MTRRWRLLTAAVLLAIPIAAACPAGAHPLGNYTVNHYAGLLVSPERVVVDYVIDMAEIPAFQERRGIDGDDDGEIDQDEQSRYRDRRCIELARGLDLRLDGQVLSPRTESAMLAFPPGQAGLSTLRLECTYAAAVASALNDRDHSLVLADRNYEERIGWREITVRGDGVTVDTSAPGESASARLTAYPTELTAPVIDRRRVEIRVHGGLPPAVASPRSAPQARAGPSRSSGELGSLIAEGDRRPVVVLMSLVAAAGLGVAHAVAPGHGKVVMATYLVGTRARARQAAGLGLAVAVSHTLGVVVLGAVTMAASAAFRPERVLPYLRLASGVIVVLVGGWLARQAWRARSAPTENGQHDHDHDHDDRRHRPQGWKALVALGMSGGLVPSTSAVLVLLAAVHLDQLALGLALIAAFGAGMAVTLVGVGMGLAVLTSGSRVTRVGAVAHRLHTRLLPVAAAVVLLLGAGMTVRAVAGLG